MGKLRSQEDDPVPQWFSRYQEATEQRLSRLEAMAAEWLCRSRKGKKENSEDQALNDEELVETEVATELNGIEDRAVENEANATMISAIDQDESIPQFQVPIANSEILKSRESGKVDLGLAKLEVGGDVERDQKVMSDTETSCAHKVLVKMPSKEKRIKHLKGWKFKFKRKSLVGIKLQIEQYKLSNRRRRMYNKLSTNIKVESAKEMVTENHPRMLRQLHKSRVQSKMRMMNDSWSMRQPTLKIMKSHRKHKWKSKQLQIASNFWINHSHKMADLVLRTALTDWRTKNSKGLAYDGCVSLETNLAGFGRGKTEMLATSQKMQKMDLLSIGIYTEMEENVELRHLLVAMERFSQEVIEPKMEGGLICGDVKFHLKHKWRFRLLESFPRLVLLAWINLWFSKAYEFSGQLQDSSKGEAETESFPFLNFAAGQHLLWMQNKSEPILIVSELERKKKLCYKTWMFKYKVDEEDQGILQSRTGWVQEVSAVICFLQRRHFHLHLDCEEPELAGRKRNHDLLFRLHNKLKKQRCPKSWMFKFKMDSKSARTYYFKRRSLVLSLLKKLLLWRLMQIMFNKMSLSFLLYKTLRSRFL